MNTIKPTTQPDCISQIKTILAKLDITLYNIIEIQQDAVELYFIKKNLDMRRRNHITDIALTVYRDFEKEGKKMRGSASTSLYNTMSAKEMESAISSAYYAASFVNNPYYELPNGEATDCMIMKSELLNHSLEENAMMMAEALYQPDTQAEVFINSAEFFSRCSHVRIVNSQGIDVSYKKATISGEFVAQCTVPEDVETYRDFKFNDLNTDALTELSKETLGLTKSRAIASSTPKSGNYDVILSDQQVETLLSYYNDRSLSDYIYPGYSNYKIGERVQDSTSEDSQSSPVENHTFEGEALNITLRATSPYSQEGIRLIDRPLITNGVLNNIQGDSRFAYYLGIPAIGHYTSMKVDNGSMAIEDMKKSPYLHIVNFSDFQMDALSGDFGGEIRLAFYNDGNKVTPVTGGSISGNISNYHKRLYFSKERQNRASFEGPKAVLLKEITVSGS